MLDATPATRWRPRPVTIALGAIVVVLVVIWIYALAFAPKGYRLAIRDDVWIEQADAICGRYASRIDELPAASAFADVEPQAEALRQRALVLDDANLLVAEQIDALRSLPGPDNERGRELVGRWLDDWDLYLADRQQQSVDWRAGLDDPFAVTADDGTYTIKGLMPGTYTVAAWHEKGGPNGTEKTMQVTVPASGKGTADFSFGASAHLRGQPSSLPMLPALEVPFMRH